MLPQIFVEVQSYLIDASFPILPPEKWHTRSCIMSNSLIYERHILIQFSAHVCRQNAPGVFGARANFCAHNFIDHGGVLHLKLLGSSLRGINGEHLPVIFDGIPDNWFVTKIVNIIFHL